MKVYSSNDVDKILREYFKKKKYCLTNVKKNGETGCDLVATRRSEKIYIETIGWNNKPGIKSREFFESFFRIISRDADSGRKRLVIALPERVFIMA